MRLQFLLLVIVAAVPIQAAHGPESLEGHPLQANGKPMTALMFSWDGQMLASGSFDGAVSIWAVASNHLVCTMPIHKGKVGALAFSPTGELVASGGGNDPSVRIWTAFGGKQLRTLDGHTNGVSALTFSPDGLTLASGGTDGAICLWNTRNWNLKRRLLSHLTGVRALRVSSNNQFLASGCDEFLRIWNLKDAGYAFDTLHERVRALSYYDLNVASPGNQKPKFESSDGRGLQLWQPSGVIGSQILAPWVSHIGIIFSKTEPNVVTVENGLMARGQTNGAVEIWDANGYGSIKVVAHRGRVDAIALSPRAVNLATAGEDGTIRLWRARILMDQANVEASRKRAEKQK